MKLYKGMAFDTNSSTLQTVLWLKSLGTWYAGTTESGLEYCALADIVTYLGYQCCIST